MYRNGQPARARRTRSSSLQAAAAGRKRSERRDPSAAPLVNGTDSVPEPQSLSLVSRSTLNTSSAPSFTVAWKPLLLATAAVLAALPLRGYALEALLVLPLEPAHPVPQTASA